LPGALDNVSPSGTFRGIKEMSARDICRRRAQCLTAAAINIFSLAEERSNKG
jgi:hypothetical protein